MKFRCLVILLLVGAVVPKATQAQASIYGEFSVTDLHNLTSTDLLYGATTGLLYDGPTIFHHLLVSADIQGRFVHEPGGKILNGITVGPRFSVPLRHGLSPYGEFMVGFARYDMVTVGGSTTDGTFQVNAGVAKRISPRVDLVADYSYAQYYAFGGQYNPKTFSAGGIFHFNRRDPGPKK